MSATDRLFFAVYPPPDAAARILGLAGELREAEGLKGRLHSAEQLHVTLFYLGDYDGLPDAVVAAASAAAGAVRAAPFAARFDRAVSFTAQARNRPFTLQGGAGVAGLAALHGALATELGKAGLASEARAPFTPHVTLLYDDKAVVERPVPPVDWVVTEFVLMRSLLGRSTHVPLGRWPLRA